MPVALKIVKNLTISEFNEIPLGNEIFETNPTVRSVLSSEI